MAWGGFVLFSQDIQGHTPESLRAMLESFQPEIPLLFAVDEEGGTVCRVSSHPAFRAEPFQSPRQYYADGGMDAVLNAEKEKGELLRSLGLNVILGPVCDLADAQDAFLYHRSLGGDADLVSSFVSQTVAIQQSQGLHPVLKHFPGCGELGDTHTDVIIDHRSLEELEQHDLLPFRAGIQAGCGAVMVSHTILSALDPEHPASLSPAVINYLQEEMGFSGVIITDDLSMGAVAQKYSQEEAAILAIEAGCTLLCTQDYETQSRAIMEAVLTGRLSREIIHKAVVCNLKWKGIL